MIYLIITTSLINKDFENRETRYIESINSILNILKDDNKIKPIIVENNGSRSTFLNDFNCDVVYTNNNQITCNHKGGNELLDIKDVINQYKIKDEDMIIKITGRYKLLDSNFIDTVKNNYKNIDAFVKFFNVCTKKFHENKDDCVLGLFALKCGFLKKFEYIYKKSPECEFAIYVRDNVKNIQQIDDLHLECCFARNLEILNV